MVFLRVFGTVLFSFCFLILHAQTDSAVQLATRLAANPSLTHTQALRLKDIALSVKYELPDSTIRWAGIILNQSRRLNDPALAIHVTYLQTEAYGIVGLYLLMEKSARDGIALSIKLGNDSLLGMGYNGLGNAQMQKGQYQEALQSLNRSLDIRTKIHDQRGIAISLFNIGNLYYASKNVGLALKYVDQALAAADNEKILISAIHLKANVYGIQHNYKEAMALDMKGLELAGKENNPFAQSMFYDNIANCYLHMRQYPKALEFFHKSLEIDSAIGNKRQMGDTYANLAAVAGNQGKTKEAIFNARRSLSLNTEAHSLIGIMKAYEQLSAIYTNSGMYEQAVDALVALDRIEDSLVSEKTSEKLAEYAALFENTKKEAEINQLKQQQKINALLLSRQRLQLIAAISIGVLLIGLGLLLYNRQRFRQKQLREKAVLDAEYKERMRIARDVHDDLGSGLSRISLMAALAERKKANNHEADIRHIAGISKELVENMRDLVWVLNPENTTLDNLQSRIREYCTDYFEESGIKGAIIFPEKRPVMKIAREAQRNLFLTVKEAVHNAVKHAHPTEIRVHVEYIENDLRITIEDNGTGFAARELAGSGNGLKNMKHRIESIGGSFSLSSGQDNGTRIVINVPFYQLTSDNIIL